LTCSDANGLATWSSLADVSVPVGTIIMWGGTLAYIASSLPNWKLCDGSSAPAGSALLALYGVMGNPFGPGKVPDLRERFVVGAGSTDNASVVGTTAYTVAATGGLNTVTLTSAQIPSHTHTFTTDPSGSHMHTYPVSDSGGGSSIRSDSGGGTTARNLGTSTAPDHQHTGTTNTTGGGTDHENRPPFYALCYIIKVN